jgi:hypothetical protein
LLIAFYFVVVSATYWNKEQLSKEKSLATYLLDAYEHLTKRDRVAAQKLVRKVSRALEARRNSTDWSTLHRESENMSGIGGEIRTILLPALADEKHSTEDLGEILVRLACLFIEGSSENMKRVPKVYQDLPRPTIAPVIPTTTRLRKVLAGPIPRIVIAAAVALFLSVAVFSVIAYLRGQPLLDLLEWIGSAFIVSFMAFIGIFFR